VLNKKVILITSLTRSGSNVLWNIMQSHPRVCSPVGETNQVLHPRGPGLHRMSRLVYRKCRAGMVRRFMDRRLYAAKLKNFDHESNRFRTQGEPYTLEELKDTVLCLKAVNEDIYLTDVFYSMYEDIHTVGLVRNGYAVCEGQVRRGEDAVKVGERYATYMRRIIEDSERLKNYTIVRFEEVVRKPFETAESLYEFCELEPTRVDRLRLKSKHISSPDGGHSRTFGRVGGKYWFDRSEIQNFIDPGVDSRQSSALSVRDRRAFEQRARPVLEHFGYACG